MKYVLLLISLVPAACDSDKHLYSDQIQVVTGEYAGETGYITNLTNTGICEVRLEIRIPGPVPVPPKFESKLVKLKCSNLRKV